MYITISLSLGNTFHIVYSEELGCNLLFQVMTEALIHSLFLSTYLAWISLCSKTAVLDLTLHVLLLRYYLWLNQCYWSHSIQSSSEHTQYFKSAFPYISAIT